MPRTYTRLELRTVIRQRADMVNSLFVTDAEFNTYIDQSYAWLYDLLVGAYGEDYFVSNVDFTTTVNTTFYSFATIALDTFYKLHGIGLLEGNGHEIILQKYMQGQRGDTTNLPEAGKIIRVYYIPAPSKLASDAATVDGVSGWEELIIVDCAIKAKDKEESDTQVLMQEREYLLLRIEQMSQNRDANMPDKPTDVRSRFDWDYFDDFYRTHTFDYNSGRTVPRYRLRGDGIAFV